MTEGKNIKRLPWIKNPDVIFQIIVLSSCIFLLMITKSYPARARIFPELLLYVIIILCCIYLFSKVFSPKLFKFFVSPEPLQTDEETVTLRKLSKTRFYRGWLSIGMTVAVFALFGFVFAIPVYFMSYFFFLGQEKNLLKIVSIALVTAAMVYLIFGYCLGLPITRGVLFDWKP